MSEKALVRDVYGETFEMDKELLVPRLSAYGIVIKDDSILLSPQFEDDMYDLPGGGLDPGEFSRYGVVREVKEETGLDVEVIESVGFDESFFTYKYDPDNPTGYHSVLMYYLCRFVGGKISTDGFDQWEKQYAKKAVWLPLDQLDSIRPASTVDWRVHVKKVLEAKK